MIDDQPKALKGYLYIDRFREALCLLCGKKPPKKMCEDWFRPSGQSDQLQDWVGLHLRLEWAQAIVAIDAAHELAHTPEEGFQFQTVDQFRNSGL